MNKILFVAVHPDDETLGCGGAILKHKNNGDEIYWLVITTGNQKFTKVTDAARKESVRKASLEYQFNKTFELDFLTTELDQYPTRNIVDEIWKVFSEVKPEIVYMPNRSDAQSDHRIAFDAIYSCTKNFRAPFVKKVLMYETLSETEFAPALPEKAFNPNVFIDVTGFLEPKLKIMGIFETQIMKEHQPRTISTIRALARYRGSRIGVEYAEAFMLLFERS